MSGNTKAVKQRIKSVKNTKKITRAMQMVAAVKMRKAINQAQNTKEYSLLGLEILKEISNSTEIDHKLLNVNEEGNELWIVIASNRGLCGSYNNNVLLRAQKMYDQIVKEGSMTDVNVISLGKRAGLFPKRNELDLLSLYEKIMENPSFLGIKAIADDIISQYSAGIYSKVKLIYTNFQSTINQQVISTQLLPIDPLEIAETLKKLGGEKMNSQLKQVNVVKNVEVKNNQEANEFVLEPSKSELLDYLLPKMVEIELYQALLESLASEHSSRMLAMKNATDSAGEMIDILTLEYNKARQAAITQEIAEIASGADALTTN